MRGRTNAEPNIGVQLNASVDTYEVATGETILAGDFIKRYEYAVNQLADSMVTDYQNNYPPIYKTPIFFRLSDGRYVCRNKIYEKSVSGEYSIAYTTTNSVPSGDYVEALDDDTFVGFSITNAGSSTSRKYQIVATYAHYDTTEHTISLRAQNVDVKTWGNVTPPETFTLCVIKKGNNSYKVAVGYSITISSSTNLTVDVFDMTLSGVDHTDYSITVANVVTTTNIGNLRWIAKISNGEDYLIHGISSSSKKIIRLNSGVFSTAIYFSDYPDSIYTAFSNYLAKPICEDGVIDVLYWTRTGSSSSNYVYYLKRKHYYFPADSWDYNFYAEESILENVYTSYVRYMGTISGKDIYVIRGAHNGQSETPHSYIVPFTIDTTTKELSVGDMVDLQENYVPNNNMIFIYSSIENNDIIMSFGYDYNVGNKLCEFSYSNGVFTSLGDNVKIVKKATSQDYIMGVAKQSGNAGDTIAVYIPQVNS